MECRPPQNHETEITENYVHPDAGEEDQEVRFLSHEQLEEYKKVQEVLLKFSREKTKNKSDLQKSLLNIAANLMRVLLILENAPNQESTSCGMKNSTANQQYKSYDNGKSLTPEDERIPKKKVIRNLEQKNDKKDAQIPRVTIKKLCNNNKPGYVGYTNRLLHESDECRINMQKPDSRSSQYIQFPSGNEIQTLLRKDEICNTQLNNETEIVFECKNVEPSITSLAPQQFDYLSQHQLQDAKISEPTRATIKDERLDMVKKEYLDDSMEKLNSNNNIETNGLSEIIPPANSLHNSEESEKLETCSKKLEKTSNLKVHKDTAPDHATHSCEICGKKFMQRNKLTIHTKVVHKRRKLYQCDTCGKTYMTKKILDRHMKSLHEGISHARDSRGKTFSQKDYLKNHINSVHNGQESHDRVSYGKIFKQKVGLKEHIESPLRSINHTCDSCGKTFRHKLSLKNHIDFVHKNLKHHQCDECPKAFSSKSGLHLHMSTVHNGITYACDLCKKMFTQKGTLTVHINTVHMDKGKLFKCDECLKSFNYKCLLTSHIEYVHKGVTHPCDLCEKVFRHKKNLKLHKDSVHNCKTHPCDLCEKVFRNRLGLKSHKDFVHKGITYPCDYCRKVFSQKSYLKKHNNSVHNGITHQCDQCEESFTKKCNLKLHINDVHNGKK